MQLTPPAPDTAQSEHWHIIGAGAMGCLWAAILSHSGKRVTIVSRAKKPEPLAPVLLTYKRNTVRPYVDKKSFARVTASRVTSQQSSGAENLPQSESQFFVHECNSAYLKKQHATINYLMIATKSYDALGALRSVTPYLRNGSSIISMCNGLGIHDELAHALEKTGKQTNFYAAVTSEAALLESPMVVVHTGSGTTQFGSYSDWTDTDTGIAAQGENNIAKAVNNRTANKASLLDGTPFNVQYSATIKEYILRKCLINCAINPLTALYNCNNGALITDKKLNAVFKDLCAELQRVYDGCSTRLSRNFDLLLEAEQVAINTYANESSMLRDYRANRRLELAHLNCQIIEVAHKLNIHCPLNEQIVEQLNGQE